VELAFRTYASDLHLGKAFENYASYICLLALLKLRLDLGKIH